MIPALPIVIRVAVVVLVLSAAAFDLRYRRIPNWLTLSGLILGFGLNLLLFQWPGALHSGEGLILATAVYLPMYMLRGMGAGDVKLMAVLGALVGPSYWLEILIGAGLLGGLAGVAYAFAKGRFSGTCCNLYFLLKDLVHFRAPYKTNPELDFRNPASLRMPHGVIIAASSVGFLLLDFFGKGAFGLLR